MERLRGGMDAWYINAMYRCIQTKGTNTVTCFNGFRTIAYIYILSLPCVAIAVKIM